MQTICKPKQLFRKKRQWIHIDKVFNVKLEDGQFPMPDPLLDNNGEQIKKDPPKKKKG